MDGDGAPAAAGPGLQAQVNALTAQLARATAERDAAREQRDDRELLVTAAMDHLGNVMSSEVSAGKMVLTQARKMMDPAIKFTEEQKDDWSSMVGVVRDICDENKTALCTRYGSYNIGRTSHRRHCQDPLSEEMSFFILTEAIKLTNSVAHAAKDHAHSSQELVSVCLRTGNGRRDRHARVEPTDICMFGMGNAVDGLFTPEKTKAFNGKRARHRR